MTATSALKINLGKFENRAHLFPVRIFYNHTDAGGVVYYANYLRMAEEARVAMFSLFGNSATTGDFVVRQATAEYLRPARLGDDLVIETRVKEMRGTSIEIAQDITRDGEAIVKLSFTMVFVSLAAFKPARIPAATAQKLKEIIHDEA